MENDILTLLRNEVIHDNDLLTTIFESMASGVFLVNLEGVIVYWNAAAEKITGFTREEILGQPCGQLPGELCADRGCREGIMQCGLFQSNNVIERECCITHKNGQDVHVMKSARVVKDRFDNPVMGIINLVDISAVKRADEEISLLKSQLSSDHQLENLVGHTPSMQGVFKDIRLASQSDASVLITGESGTGKELAAQAIHYLSSRVRHPIVIVNCCSLPESLLESELFGHMKGAFTGALRDQPGRFEAADNGTVFLDEIGELPLSIQVKLLRFLQSHTVERIGENRSRHLNVRIVSATNHDLRELVEKGQFREDLYYRINVFPIRIPPLRERTDDIPLLIEHFLTKFRERTGKNVTSIQRDALRLMLNYHWPGNVRELENAIEHAFVRNNSDCIEIYDLPENILKPVATAPLQTGPVKHQEMNRQRVLDALLENNWHREKTAQALGVSRVTLWKWIKEFKLQK